MVLLSLDGSPPVTPSHRGAGRGSRPEAPREGPSPGGGPVLDTGHCRRTDFMQIAGDGWYELPEVKLRVMRQAGHHTAKGLCSATTGSLSH